MKCDRKTSKIIREAYVASGYTFTQISEMTGIAASSIANITSDTKRYVSLEMCKKFADALNIPFKKIAAAWKSDRLEDIEKRAAREKENINVEIEKYIKRTEK
jgi:transcriptional regulator with XRE-family HTH domain